MKILLAEDQAMLRDALVALLEMEPGFKVTAAENGKRARQLLESEEFDMLLTDIEMPEITGLELADWLGRHRPQTRVVIITTFNRAGYIRRALSLQAGGFLLKDAPSDELIAALYKVHDGGRVIDPELALLALDDRDPLTDKERKALRLAHEGKSTGDIARQLHLTEGTVRNYLSEAISKLNATNRVDAARIARQKGWL